MKNIYIEKLGLLVSILYVAALLTCSAQNGVCLMLIALAVSPVGLPMVAEWVIGQIQNRVHG